MFRDFLEHPRVKAAITLVKDHFIKLLRHVFPTKIKGNLTFGKHGSLHHRKRTGSSRYDHSTSQKLYCRNSCIWKIKYTQMEIISPKGSGKSYGL